MLHGSVHHEPFAWCSKPYDQNCEYFTDQISKPYSSVREPYSSIGNSLSGANASARGCFRARHRFASLRTAHV